MKKLKKRKITKEEKEKFKDFSVKINLVFAELILSKKNIFKIGMKGFLLKYFPNIPKGKIDGIVSVLSKCDKTDNLIEKILIYFTPSFEIDDLLPLIDYRIEMTKEKLMKSCDIKPCDNKEHWCETCGSHSHLEMSDSGYCYFCDTDNWMREGRKTSEI